jgi:aryl-alcohol dehydrogenase-like predicted oxidoreductase
MTPARAPDPAAGIRPAGLVPLEAAGVRIPRIGLGTFRTSSDEARVLVRRALEVGYRHIDTAMRYDNEPGVGHGVRDSSVPRGEVFVTTKFPHTLAARGDVVQAARASIAALGLDYADLLLMHWPNAEVPVEETFEALAPLVADGVIRALGMSNAPAALVRRAQAVTRLATVQVEHHPYLPQDTLHELVAAADCRAGDTVLAAAQATDGGHTEDVTARTSGAEPRHPEHRARCRGRGPHRCPRRGPAALLRSALAELPLG